MVFNFQLTKHKGSVLLKRIGIILLCMQLSRFLFWWFNRASFIHISFSDFFASFWLDLVSVSLIGFPFIVLSLLPFSFTNHAVYQRAMRVIFYLVNALFCALNLIDVEYFSYTQKRSTTDLFTVLAAGDDFSQQIGSFFKDFWLLLVFFALLMFLSQRLERRIKTITSSKPAWLDYLLYLFIIGVFVVLGRGGFGLKPINAMDASRYTRVENAALVLNTPFTMIKSMNNSGLEEKHYFDLKTELALFNPIQPTKPANLFPPKTNVVIIILESFGSEWVGASGAEQSFTPFLDSLAAHSLYFVNGLANGKKSIEAVPAVVSSIPSLMDNPYISSSYGNNEIASLASILNKEGYETGFFHGATNGSMRFDGFAAQVGFQDYMGRTEYNNDAHFDGTWGILDEYFNPWTARQLSKYDKPFFATLFTLSSHHPYFIPKHLRGKLKKGPLPICESIHYGDYSLKKFFEQAKKEPWFQETIFVICADHTSATSSETYNQRTEMYKVPILFYDPQGRIEAKVEQRVFQQLDIMPTLLDLLNIQTKIYAYGHSYYQPEEAEAINYIGGSYNYYRKDHMITYSNDKVRNLYHIRREKDTPDSLKYYRKEAQNFEQRLKAIIQRYHRDLILNQTKVK